MYGLIRETRLGTRKYRRNTLGLSSNEPLGEQPNVA